MIPFHFGPPERRLFGVFHPSAQRAQIGVVLCNPFGQEAIRIHRFFRVLAERLSRSGIDVLRFDPFGTGDSAGDDEDADLDGWCTDVHLAHNELIRRSGAMRVTWLGARLGATMALGAAGSPPPRLRALMLWDPIVGGPEYLRLLRLKHVEALETSYGVVGPAWRERLTVNPTEFESESMGFALPPRFRAQLQALSLDPSAVSAEIDISVLADAADATVQEWAQSAMKKGRNIRVLAASDRFDWTAEEAMNTALVPGQTLQQLVTALVNPHE